MNYIADLHIHSHFSIATSKQLTPSMLDYWGRKKGIAVVGTGDATHPGWLAELKKNVISSDNGFYQVRKGSLQPDAAVYGSEPVSLVLTAEISCIYKRDGKVRKVHNLVLAPEFSSFEKIQKELGKRGNITSDGRPILGLDSRDLLEILLTADSRVVLIPAHIWTPWFSVLGSKSGFDSIDACYGDLAEHIFAVETGLSSDPPMNRRCSFLDRYTLISNSDAHSPEKLGREANLFDTEFSYSAMIAALKSPKKGLLGTIEYFPEEGKYHLDGHRTCAVCWEPEKTVAEKGICPVCGKPVTVGVLHRVNELADRPFGDTTATMLPFHALTGLKSVLSEGLGVGAMSKKVSARYDEFLRAFGSEFTILRDTPYEDLKKFDRKIATGINMLRTGQVQLTGGYDGVFGAVRVFGP